MAILNKKVASKKEQENKPASSSNINITNKVASGKPKLYQNSQLKEEQTKASVIDILMDAQRQNALENRLVNSGMKVGTYSPLPASQQKKNSDALIAGRLADGSTALTALKNSREPQKQTILQQAKNLPSGTGGFITNNTKQYVEGDIRGKHTDAKGNVSYSIPVKDVDVSPYEKKKADEIRARENARMIAEETAKARVSAEKNPLFGEVQNVATRFAGSIMTPIGVISGHTDPNDPMYAKEREAQAYNQGVKTGVKNKFGVEDGTFASGAVDFGVDTLTSMIETGLRAAVGGGIGSVVGGAAGATAETARKIASAVGSTQASLSAFSSGYVSAKDKGVDNGTAIMNATAQGIAEWFFERFSIDRLLKDTPIYSFKDAVKEIGKNMLTEGSEEFATDIANAITDRIIMGKDSDFSIAKAAYIRSGMTEVDATKYAVLDVLKQASLSFLGGAISGGMLGSGKSVGRAFFADRAANNSTMTAEQMRETADAIDPSTLIMENGRIDTEAAQKIEAERTFLNEAAQKLESGKALTNAEKARAELGVTDVVSNSKAVTARGIEDRAEQFPAKAAETYKRNYDNTDIVIYDENMKSAYLLGAKGESLESLEGNEGFMKFFGSHADAVTEMWQEGVNDYTERVKAENVVSSKNFVYTERQKNGLSFIGKTTGYKFTAQVSRDPNMNAKVDIGSKTIYFNPNSEQAGDDIIHEFGHITKSIAQVEFKEVQDSIVGFLARQKGYSDATTFLDDAMADYRKTYEKQIGRKLTDDEVIEEIVCDAMPAVFSDEKELKRLAKENRTFVQKVLDFINEMIEALTSFNVTGDANRVSREIKAHATVEELTDMRRKALNALNAVNNNAGAVNDITSNTSSNEEAKGIVETSGTMYSFKVDDRNTLDFLNEQKKTGNVIHTYKAMQLVGGELHSPMAAKVKGEDGKYHWSNSYEKGVWYQATEDLSGAKFKQNGQAYYILQKGNGKAVEAAYNPYEHSSNLVLNDQFEEAYNRPNLRVVECIIPKSEMTSGYHAEHAKDSTGFIPWKSGTVAKNLKNTKRNVYLSRWIQPVRILNDAEVAAMYKDIFDAETSDISVPFNVVTPGLLSELEKAGVAIDYEGSPIYKAHNKAENRSVLETLDTKGAEAVTKELAPDNLYPDTKYSLKMNDTIMNGAIKANDTNMGATYGHADEETLENVAEISKRVASRLNELKMYLPADNPGQVLKSNGSYGRSAENSLICPRSLVSANFMDIVSEKLGKPLSINEQIIASQVLANITGMQKECTYCYVKNDRAKYREFFNEYYDSYSSTVAKVQKNREGYAESIKAGKENNSLYDEFLAGRKSTDNMWNRYTHFVNSALSGDVDLTLKDLATASTRAEAKKNRKTAWLVNDAEDYCRSSAWPTSTTRKAKVNGAWKQVEYISYNGSILKMKPELIEALNKEFGLRLYSYSDYMPHNILENIQMITDASVRGLKVLAYTKDAGFAKVFAPSGAAINISVFGEMKNGEMVADEMMGSNWEEVKALRNSHKNVGAVFVATNDEAVEWALAQDWIDVVIPFHTVRTGTEFANYYGYTNYKAEQEDKKLDSWGEGNLKSIPPTIHANDKETYLKALKENNLSPRFEKWIDNPNYMKLVNETRMAYTEMQPVQAKFNEADVMAEVDRIEKEGVYGLPQGLRDREVADDLIEDYAEKAVSEIAEGRKNEKLSLKVDRDYMKAVESGDMETAQKMVDEEAKKAGYNIAAYHGTNEKFNVFDTTKIGKNYIQSIGGFYFTSDEEVAGNYSKVRKGIPNVISAYIKMENPVTANAPSAVSAIDYIDMHSAEYEYAFGLDPITKERDHDGIIVNGKDQTIYIVPDSNQIKSADPVTYDDNGKVIPLSERFNEKNDDIRYSLNVDSSGRHLTEAQQEYFKDSKVRDEEGNLIVVYHGTDAEFTVFDRTKGRSNADIQGMFFSPWDIDAGGYGKNVGEYYLNIKNPASEATGYKALRMFQGQNNAGVKAREYLISKGYDGVNNGNEEYIAFYPEQIKLTSNENPTENEDIRYSLNVDDYIEKGTAAYAEAEKEAEREDLRNKMGIDEESNGLFLTSAYKELQEANNAIGELLSKTKFLPAETNIRNRAKKLIESVNSSRSVDEVAEKLSALYEYIYNSEQVDGELVSTAASDLAEWIVEARGETETEYSQERRTAIRKVLKGQTIHITPDLLYTYDWLGGGKALRKFFGTVTFSKKSGMDVDIVYQELNEMAPDIFPMDDETGEYNLWNKADQLRKIVDVLGEPREYETDNLSEEDYGTMAYELGQTIFDDYFKTRFVAEDKQMQRLYEMYKNSINRFKESQKREMAKYKERYNDRLKASRQMARDRYTKFRERENSKAVKKAIIRNALSLTRMLEQPTNSKHVPEAFRKPLASFLQNIDFSSEDFFKTGNVTKRTNDWLAMQNALAAELNRTEDANTPYFNVDPDLVAKMESIRDSLKTVARIEDMPRAALFELRDTLVAIKKCIETADEMIASRQKRKVSDVGNGTISELSKLESNGTYKGFFGTASNLLTNEMLDAETRFHTFGTHAEEVLEELRDGFNKKIRCVADAADYIGKLKEELDVTDKDIKEWESTEIRAGGVSLRTDYAMSLYELMKRKQAKDHILKGGITPVEYDDLSTKINKLTKKQKGGSIIHLTEAMVMDITSHLTEKQIKFADGAAKYFATVAEWGNEATMAAYGYRKFTEENYFPIKTDSNYRDTRTKDFMSDGMNAIKSMGFTKNVVKGATNPIYIEGILDVFTNHIEQMSSYAGFLNALDDVQKWYNYRPTIETEDGYHLRSDVNVKTEIKNTYGEGAQKYVEKLLKDINGTTRNEKYFASGLISAFKGSAVGANLSVAIQQPTSYIRAMAVLEPKYLIKAFGKKSSVSLDTIKKYSPIAQWKDWGFYDTNVGRSMRYILTGATTKAEEIRDKQMWLAGKGDEITWKQLWSACEEKVKDTTKLEVGSESFYKKVAEVFDDVIDRTQVVDTVFHRTDVMRNKNALTQMSTSFMSEPMKSYNMLYRAAFDAATKKDKESKGKLGMAVLAFLMSNAGAAAAKSLITAMRKSGAGRDKEYWERWNEAFIGEFTDNIRPSNFIPYIRDIVSIFEGYTVDRTDMASVKNFYYAWSKWKKFISGESTETFGNLVLYTTKAISDLTGIALYGAQRDVNALIDTAFEALGLDAAEYEKYRLFGKSIKNKSNAKDYVGIAIRAYMKNNNALGDKIIRDMLGSGIEQKTIDEKMVDALKANDQVREILMNNDSTRGIATKAEAKVLTADESKKTDIVDKIISSGKSGNDKVDMYKALYPDDFESDKYTAWKKSGGTDFDYIKYKNDMAKLGKQESIVRYIKNQTSDVAKQKALWNLAGYVESTFEKNMAK